MEIENDKCRRRTDSEQEQVGDYFTGKHRYYDQVNEVTVVKVRSGESYATTKKGEMLVTVIGSGISVCMYDPVAKVGGMANFLLPESKNADIPLKYGQYILERLVEELTAQGASKAYIEVKVFGGADIIKNVAMTGEKNVDFINQHLKDQKFRILQADLGGSWPRRIHYYPDTGKAMMRTLRRDDDLKKITVAESAYQFDITHKAENGDFS